MVWSSTMQSLLFGFPVMVGSNCTPTGGTLWALSARTAGIVDTPIGFPAALDHHAESFFGPKAANLLVINLAAVVSGIHRGPPIPPPGMRAGIVTQPRPQNPIRIIRFLTFYASAGCGPGQPDQSKGEPLADIERVNHVNHGPTPTRRVQ